MKTLENKPQEFHAKLRPLIKAQGNRRRYHPPHTGPSKGVFNAPIMESRVDFPDPDSPTTMATNSPCRIWKAHPLDGHKGGFPFSVLLH